MAPLVKYCYKGMQACGQSRPCRFDLLPLYKLLKQKGLKMLRFAPKGTEIRENPLLPKLPCLAGFRRFRCKPIENGPFNFSSLRLACKFEIRSLRATRCTDPCSKRREREVHGSR